jgi:alkaline phosphatase D
VLCPESGDRSRSLEPNRDTILLVSLSRRRFLEGVSAAAFAWPLAASARHPASPSGLFRHGIASGDPLTDRVMLWTRVTTPAPTVKVRWRIATDEKLGHVVASGSADTSAARDWTVKVDAGGLRPGRSYYYAFDANGDESPIGRTKTLPEDSVARVQLAQVSCSNYPAGYFNVYRCLANRTDLDAVLHLGDYIYEFANGTYGDGSAMSRVPLPAGEATTLADYRARYATYRSDVDLQAAHATHPFIVVWDDHEIINDASRDGAPGHRGTAAQWQTRRAEAYQAYLEWMPVREFTGSGIHLYRDFRFGRLVDLLMLDTRGLRDRQAPPRDVATLGDTRRSVLGADQEAWLFANLRRSQQAGHTWRLLGQQILFAPLTPPGVAPQNTDVWDGYPPARTRVMDYLEREAISNVAILTGDIHSSWAMDVPRNPFRGYTPATGAGSLAVELVTPAISSPPLFAGAGMREATMLLRLAAPHLRYLDGENRGYVLLDIDAKRLRADWYLVPTVSTRSADEVRAARFVCENGAKHLVSD